MRIEKCEGLSCEVTGAEKLYKFVEWNKPDSEHWLCKEHFEQKRELDDKQKRRFIEYYKDPFTRVWLDEKGLKLWERLSNQ
ncbi:hypothetical protein [Niallia nealsonii]|uniref:Uncharacterized protein n=1 Tax=Niallia nealsonii TaxID=115979 RepID=A0A2N0YZE3_9BACI|nr:hypothetical protein [Niallia nealsonii]PKG22619.1 hypothetical protein CWS01_15925 [Niallia nealsonii]